MNRWGRPIHWKNANFTIVTDLYPLEPYNCAEESRLYNNEHVGETTTIKESKL